MRRLLIVLLTFLLGLGVLTTRQSEALFTLPTGTVCWNFDNFPTDFIKADIKHDLLSKLKVVAGYWRIIICPGCGNEHVGRIPFVGTLQDDIAPEALV